MSIFRLAPKTPAADQCQGFVTELVLRCGRGDEAALAELFDLTYFLVVATLRGDPSSFAGADEDVIDAYRRIWRRSVLFVPSKQGVVAWVLEQAADTNTGTRASGGEQYQIVTA
ncbi:hypothetical protein [Nocardioides zhouii]|uniref:Uncharacterized protein n=1 Tax=Nocardioides zhouii TaxID=1168729 RepID=A0A4Q2TCI7_9ACTN|nr:hypothetical protein [Nocardioides zhouii]RYC14868.1 hypothetical protein EUA94_01740 [Nocardioides zhouii]